MKPSHIFTFSLPTLISFAAADIQQAEQSLKDGHAEAALQALEDCPQNDDTRFWKGRALISLKRHEEAIATLRQVSPESTYYPYAAKGLIYCARHTPNGEELLRSLCNSPNEQIATLAQLRLAEIQTIKQQKANIEPLHKLGIQDAAIRAGLLLLEAEQHRHNKEFDKALALCKKVEASAPTRQREYSRLLIAEIFYAQETTSGASSGKGEETLLQFISTYPESDLAEEAFRRLEQHGAFITSKYAHRKLEEWAKDNDSLHRALLAYAVLQRINLQNSAYAETGENIVHHAVNLDPTYLPATVQICNLHADYLVQNGQSQQAATYLTPIPADKQDAYSIFLMAQTLEPKTPQALSTYLQCAAKAPATLAPIAMSNALYCAWVAGKEDKVQELLQINAPEPVQRALLLTHAGLIIKRDAKVAKAEAERVLGMTPTADEIADATLLLTQIDLANGEFSAALNKLSKFTTQDRLKWPTKRVMYYYGLYLHALDCEQTQGYLTDSHKNFLQDSLKSTMRDDVREAISLTLAKIYADEGNHYQALQLLEALAAKTADRDMRARALLLAGRESTQCLTYASVTKGAQLFEQAAAIDSIYRYRAAVLNAAIMFRINRVEEATTRITSIIKEIEEKRNATPGSTLLSEEYAFALTVLADIQAKEGSKPALEQAIKTNSQITSIPGLTQAWHNRTYLQQAIFCSRSGKYEQALLNYRNIINSIPKDTRKNGTTPGKDDKAYILTLAGTGAIDSLRNLKRKAEAAQMATEIAAHPVIQAYPERVALFLEWAKILPTETGATTNR